MKRKALIKLLHISEENYSRKWRLKFHLTPRVGYMGNPITIFSPNNEHHIFFRYSPFDTDSETDFWGHFSTCDFITYKRSEPALYCNSPYDCNGLLSGSALFDNEKIDIFYVGTAIYSSQKHETNIILSENINTTSPPIKTLLLNKSNLPENITFQPVNPKVWKDNNNYYMLLGIGNNENCGEALLYQSENKYTWELKNIISPPEKLGEKWLSAEYFIADGIKFISVCYSSSKEVCGYMPLDGDICNGYKLSDFTPFDYGFDFCYPAISKDEQGRLILIAQMGTTNPENINNPTISFGWLHALTAPRVIKQKNGKLLQSPIEELLQLRKNEISLDFSGEKNFDNLTVFDCILTGKNINITIRNSLEISHTNNEISIKFIKNGYGRKSRSINCSELKNIRILADISSVELFFNDGEFTFTTRYYPENEQTSLLVIGENITLNLWEMNEFNYI